MRRRRFECMGREALLMLLVMQAAAAAAVYAHTYGSAGDLNKGRRW